MRCLFSAGILDPGTRKSDVILHWLYCSYQILELELLRAGVAHTGPMARSMLRLDSPPLDWVKIGEGFGVPAVAVDSAEALARELERALMQKGPRLIEAIMADVPRSHVP